MSNPKKSTDPRWLPGHCRECGAKVCVNCGRAVSPKNTSGYCLRTLECRSASNRIRNARRPRKE